MFAVKKTKKKKKTGAGSHHHHKGFKMSKGYNIFRDIDGSCSPLPEGFSEEDIVTHVAGKKPLLGKVLRRDSDGICVRYRCYTYGVEYKPGDAVYIESNRSESPFYICAIQVCTIACLTLVFFYKHLKIWSSLGMLNFS